MIYDTHTHSTNSDGRQSVDEMCLSAIEKGVRGIALTDHADMNFYEERNTLQRMTQSISDIGVAKEKYKGKLDVFCGVELGEYLYAPENAKKILNLTKYDVILCSVHYLPQARWPQPYNRIPFHEDITDEELTEYLRLYFQLLSQTIDAFDFDVLAHITCPVRYMTGRYERVTDVMMFEDQIREVLKKIIDRNIALEFNTGGLYEKLHYCNIQNEEIFPLYKSLGGRLITLGSDAHSTGSVANQFDHTIAQLKSYGFDAYHYYENRIAKEIKI